MKSGVKEPEAENKKTRCRVTFTHGWILSPKSKLKSPQLRAQHNRRPSDRRTLHNGHL